jgi:hypothetical protein
MKAEPHSMAGTAKGRRHRGDLGQSQFRRRPHLQRMNTRTAGSRFSMDRLG